jgi:hypothetical protein
LSSSGRSFVIFGSSSNRKDRFMSGRTAEKLVKVLRNLALGQRQFRPLSGMACEMLLRRFHGASLRCIGLAKLADRPPSAPLSRM